MSWANVPICRKCWYGRRVKDPLMMLSPPVEECAQCGQETLSGIYVRAEVDENGKLKESW